MTVVFADEHIEQIEDRETVAELVDYALTVIRSLEVEHGPVKSLTPGSGRWSALAPEEAARRRSSGADVVNVRGLSYGEAMGAVGLGPLDG